MAHVLHNVSKFDCNKRSIMSDEDPRITRVQFDASPVCMMSRDESHIRDKLIMLAESTKPFNVKRKSITKQMSKGSSGKLSMQDFVRMDPSYTPDIEHLVFPSRKRNPQQVAPAIIQSSASKTRSRLAEMFALSRHLQQRSADRETSKSTRKASAAVAINRSVDSMLETPRDSGIGSSSAGSTSSRRGARAVGANCNNLRFTRCVLISTNEAKATEYYSL
ncbi:uncharacterized protein [Atheta coriaria]|uniref:uncharacterized protein n=1 Tax=Dalotia coriaria TaxID=877792 RepID=UPI0031F3DF05